MKTYTLVITDGDTTTELNVNDVVAGLIKAVGGYYESWIETMQANDLSADDALELWTANYRRAECEEEGYNAAEAFVSAIGIPIPDPHELDEEVNS